MLIDLGRELLDVSPRQRAMLVPAAMRGETASKDMTPNARDRAAEDAGCLAQSHGGVPAEPVGWGDVLAGRQAGGRLRALGFVRV